MSSIQCPSQGRKSQIRRRVSVDLLAPDGTCIGRAAITPAAAQSDLWAVEFRHADGTPHSVSMPHSAEEAAFIVDGYSLNGVEEIGLYAIARPISWRFAD